jgi:intron-binding protein aquarius
MHLFFFFFNAKSHPFSFKSLFARFVRLGVPTINLDAQGRARPDIAALYNWRYETLANLSHVIDSAEFKQANPGFAHDFQLVNVEDYEGHGEIEPTPYFYQNLGEAEYVVATFMYMRMIGYVNLVATFPLSRS